MTLSQYIHSKNFILLALKVEDGHPFAKVEEDGGFLPAFWTPVPPDVEITGGDYRKWVVTA